MKKSSILATCGLGVLAATAVAAPSNAETKAPIVGNLQHTDVKYWCDKGTPNFVFGVRALKTQETTVSVAYQGTTLVKLGPVTATRPLTVFATKNLAGRTLPLTVTGDTTKTSFPITVTVPKTCAGLPNTIDGSAPAKPSAPTTKPSTPSTKPTAPATKPSAPVTKPSKPSMPVTPPVKPTMPSKPAPGQGPKIDTDYVPTHQDNSSELALGAFGLAAAGAGSVLVARRAGKR